MIFSVIIVSLNAGDKLKKTIESALSQKGADFEVVIKDGLSSDGSIDEIMSLYPDQSYREKSDPNTAELVKKTDNVSAAAEKPVIRIYEQPDTGIYDAMNQAISHAEGDFYIFMNCGDYFYDDQVLARFKTAAYNTGFSDGATNTANVDSSVKTPLILYGNKYSCLTGTVERISPRITPLVLFRNIPCHQAICYSKENFEKRLYKPEYKIRADYEHFLWSVLKNKARTVYIDHPVCIYEGGGYSESAGNIRRSTAEHREITRMYLTPWQLFYCNLYMIVTLRPLRKKLSSGKFSGIYNAVLKKIYD